MKKQANQKQLDCANTAAVQAAAKLAGWGVALAAALAIALAAAAFTGCEQEAPKTTGGGGSGPVSDANGNIQELFVYDDVDKTTPLELKNSVGSENNEATARPGAQTIYITVTPQHPADVKVSISSGITTGIQQGTEAAGVALNADAVQIKIKVAVTGAASQNKEYSVQVNKNPADIVIPEIELVSTAVGSKDAYWTGKEMPYNGGDIDESRGYATLNDAMAAIQASGTGTADDPDIVMLGRSVLLDETVQIPSGVHVKLTVPKYRTYTIKRKETNGIPFGGTFFLLENDNSSLTIEPYDAPGGAESQIDSYLTLDGGALWKNNGLESDAVKGTNEGYTMTNAFIDFRAGSSVTIKKWVSLQNNDISQTGNNTAYNGGAIRGDGSGSLIIHDGVIIKNNKANVGGAIVIFNKKTRIYGGLFQGNYATQNAGVMFMTATTSAGAEELTIAGGIFYNNAVLPTGNSFRAGILYVDNTGFVRIGTPRTLGTLYPDEYPEFASSALASAADIPALDWNTDFPAYNKDGDAAYMAKITQKGLILFKTFSAGDTAGIWVPNGTRYAQKPLEIYDAVFEGGEAKIEHGGVLRDYNPNGFILKNSVFRNNSAAKVGGSVLVQETLAATSSVTVENCLFSKNKSSVTTASEGGGLWFGDMNCAAIDIKNCEFLENESTYAGAGIRMRVKNTNVTLENCRFYKNKANNLGGGIYFVGLNKTDTITGQPLTVTLNKCVFEENQGTWGAGAFLDGPGYKKITGSGGDYAPGASLAARMGADKSGWTVFKNNTAVSGGGGLDIAGDTSESDIDYCEFRGNKVTSDNSDTAGGGAMRLESPKGGVFTIGKNVIVAGNKAQYRGGGIQQLNMNKLSFNGIIGGPEAADANYAGVCGGGILVVGNNRNGIYPFETTFGADSVITNNGSINDVDQGQAVTKVTQWGGGIAHYYWGRVRIEGQVTGNSASNGGGGYFMYETVGNPPVPLGLTYSIEGQLANTAKISGNQITVSAFSPALNLADALTNTGNNNFFWYNAGGGVYLYNNQNTTQSTTASFTIEADGSTGSGRIAEISGNKAARGGGIFARGKVLVFMNGGAIKTNETVPPSPALTEIQEAWQNEVAYYGGGGVYMHAQFADAVPVFTMNAGEISGNTAKNTSTGKGAFGGGVYMHQWCVFSIPAGSTGIIKNNVSQWKGGGIAIIGSVSNQLTMYSAFSKMEGNTAALYGGAIYATVTPTIVKTIANNALTVLAVTDRVPPSIRLIDRTAGAFSGNTVGTGGKGNHLFILKPASGTDLNLGIPLTDETIQSPRGPIPPDGTADEDEVYQIFDGDDSTTNYP